VYRLSESDVFEDHEKPPKPDILDKINKELFDLEQKEEQLKQKLSKVKEQATMDGRRAADEHISNLDTVFKPLGYNPNDSKPLFHPIDFVVFNGMNDINNPSIKNIVLLDSVHNKGVVQESIRSCIENEQYQFLTIKIKSDGETVIEE